MSHGYCWTRRTALVLGLLVLGALGGEVMAAPRKAPARAPKLGPIITVAANRVGGTVRYTVYGRFFVAGGTADLRHITPTKLGETGVVGMDGTFAITGTIDTAPGTLLEFRVKETGVDIFGRPYEVYSINVEHIRP